MFRFMSLWANLCGLTLAVGGALMIGLATAVTASAVPLPPPGGSEGTAPLT